MKLAKKSPVASTLKPVEPEINEVTEVKIIALDEKAPKTNKSKPAVKKDDGFCVYIGPSIRGVIQSGTIYAGSRVKTEAFLAPAIKKYPLISKMISTNETLAADRIKVKTAGNLLNVYYKKLASGKSM